MSLPERRSMEGQMSIFDYHGEPDYHGSHDEIVRMSIEDRFTGNINLFKCECGSEPIEMFKSCHDYFVKCPTCRRQTKMFRFLYKAKQAWNKGECDGKIK